MSPGNEPDWAAKYRRLKRRVLAVSGVMLMVVLVVLTRNPWRAVAIDSHVEEIRSAETPEHQGRALQSLLDWCTLHGCRYSLTVWRSDGELIYVMRPESFGFGNDLSAEPGPVTVQIDYVNWLNRHGVPPEYFHGVMFEMREPRLIQEAFRSGSLSRGCTWP